MKYYTKEQMKKLEEIGAVQHFNTVINSQYKRGTSTQLDNAVADIYDEATGGKVSRHFGCKTCVMNLYRNAGQLYRKTQEYNKQKLAEQLKKAREAKELKKKLQDDNFPPAVEAKGGTITFNFERALAEEAELKEKIKNKETEQNENNNTTNE